MSWAWRRFMPLFLFACAVSATRMNLQDIEDSAHVTSPLLQICTFNLYQGWDYGLATTGDVIAKLNQAVYDKMVKPLESKNPISMQLLLVQEAPNLGLDSGLGTEISVPQKDKGLQKWIYETWYNRGTEKMATVFPQSKAEYVVGTTDIDDEPCFGGYRKATVTKIRVPDNFPNSESQNVRELKIANVHLCGGRFDDRRVWANPGDTKGGRASFMKELIEKHSPDIIVGDFNGDKVNHASNEQNMKVQRDGYIKDVHGTLPEATIYAWLDWLQEPFNVLEEQGYASAQNLLKKDFFLTTPFGIMVDYIYIKQNLIAGKKPVLSLKSLDSWAYGFMKNGRGKPGHYADAKPGGKGVGYFTDHAPVCAVVEVLPIHGRHQLPEPSSWDR